MHHHIFLIFLVCASTVFYRGGAADPPYVIALKNITFTHSLSRLCWPESDEFESSVVPANHACNQPQYCPEAVFLSSSEKDVALLVKHLNEHDIPISVKGGGHGYTCQSMANNAGGVLLDMKLFTDMQVYWEDGGGNNNRKHYFAKVGAGLTFANVLDFLKKDHSDLRVAPIHGQCAGVGVAGFSLHGGVHFGALSERFGLATPNIKGLTAVVANGSIVTLRQRQDDAGNADCNVDTIRGGNQHECSELWFALRGTASSFAVVTSLTLALHPTQDIQTALAVVSLKLDPQHQEEALSRYLSSISPSISITLFGLDAAFKANAFVLMFASKKRNVLRHLFASLQDQNKKQQHKKEASSSFPIVYFVAEASWLTQQKQNDSLHLLHLEYELDLQQQMLSSSPWWLTNEPWRVQNYDAVWGSGHSYGGATVSTTNFLSPYALDALLTQFSLNVADKKCSDCVAVVHRIGPGLKKGLVVDETKEGMSNATTSFHPFLASRSDAYVWVEFDCGHFFRKRSSWPTCSDFIGKAQAALDESIAKHDTIADSGEKTLSSSFHYANVPNLRTDTKSWRYQYFGNDARIQRLLDAKAIWDKNNVFRHAQSIVERSTTPPLPLSSPKALASCARGFMRKATRDVKNALTLLLAGAGSAYVLPRLWPRRWWKPFVQEEGR